jgi:hypothetical protein
MESRDDSSENPQNAKWESPSGVGCGHRRWSCEGKELAFSKLHFWDYDMGESRCLNIGFLNYELRNPFIDKRLVIAGGHVNGRS